MQKNRNYKFYPNDILSGIDAHNGTIKALTIYGVIGGCNCIVYKETFLRFKIFWSKDLHERIPKSCNWYCRVWRDQWFCNGEIMERWELIIFVLLRNHTPNASFALGINIKTLTLRYCHCVMEIIGNNRPLIVLAFVKFSF